MYEEKENFLTICECADFLGLSRPTFNLRRKEYKFLEKRVGTKTYISKAEIIVKAFAKEKFEKPHLNFMLTEKSSGKSIYVDENTLDLRRLSILDAYGVLALLTEVIAKLENNTSLYFVVADTSAIRVLKHIGFFKELKRRFPDTTFWDEPLVESLNESTIKVFQPIRYIGVKGQDRGLLEGIIPALTKQGFKSEVTGYIGWLIGELADNSHTHAKGPCYILIAQLHNSNTKFLDIAIGDTGMGIHKSLKSNPKYKSLSDETAFLKAFKSKVSSWSDEADRGKGLNDILAIAMGNKSVLGVDSGPHGIMFNFTSFEREVEKRRPIFNTPGTRFCLCLINEIFKKVDRAEVDRFIERQI
jgi:hypothetical protein